MAQETLITAWEVVKYSPESDKFPTGLVQPHIYPKERTFRRVYLGKEFYDLLLADKVDYGVVEEWDATATYASGDYVDYFGTTLVSLTSGNNTQPCEDQAGEFWEEPDKFTTECYQNLWELYLRQYLAYYIIPAALPHATYPSGGKGVTEWIDDGSMRQGAGSKSASQGVLASRLNILQNEANEILQNMRDWMNDQNDAGTCDFSLAIPCIESNPTPQRRRIAYRSGYE